MTPPDGRFKLIFDHQEANSTLAVSVDSRRLKLTNDEGTEGVLLGFRCQECGIHVFGPATFCQGCSSSNLSPVELGKQGILYSFTIVRIPPQGWPGDVPYVLGQIELAEGPQVLAEVIDCRHDDLKIGMNVELALRLVEAAEGGAERVVYKWQPV
ncbi:MAG: hypothetical protein BZY81_02440 [SAR202 cluster bacterium Io17-Chloro-G4]|nr:MAG: hypothetical protein BZY81_02440 [SAR202 cluster bacterium Io17-Chloro-G4]